MKAGRIPLIVGALALLVAAAGCSTSGNPLNSNGLPGDEGSFVQFSPADRKPVPELSGDLVGDGHADLSTAAGKVVVLNVWAEWCGPCVAETPGLVAAAHALPGVEFMGINIRDNEGNAAAYERTYHVPYPSFYDQGGQLLLDLRDAVTVTSPPQTIILDKQHRVAAVIYGTTTQTTIEEIVKPLEREA